MLFKRSYGNTGYSSGLNFIKFLKDEQIGTLQRDLISAPFICSHLKLSPGNTGIVVFYNKSANIRRNFKEQKHLNVHVY